MFKVSILSTFGDQHFLLFLSNFFLLLFRRLLLLIPLLLHFSPAMSLLKSLLVSLTLFTLTSASTNVVKDIVCAKSPKGTYSGSLSIEHKPYPYTLSTDSTGLVIRNDDVSIDRMSSPVDYSTYGLGIYHFNCTSNFQNITSADQNPKEHPEISWGLLVTQFNAFDGSVLGPSDTCLVAHFQDETKLTATLHEQTCRFSDVSCS